MGECLVLICDVCLVIDGGGGESPRRRSSSLPHLNVKVTVLNGYLVLITVGGNGTCGLNICTTSYVCSVDGGVPGSPLDVVVCLSVIILSIIVLILMRSCVRIKYKYRNKYVYSRPESAFLNKMYISGFNAVSDLR